MFTNIQTLEAYVAQMNTWRAVWKKPALSLQSAKDRQTIANSIDGELSPENLTCDGELPANMVRQRYNRLTRCAQELMSIDSTVTFYEFS
jgi:hypothetical protein